MDHREANKTRQLADNAARIIDRRENEQKVPRSRMQPLSTISCQYEALVGKAAHPRKTMDYEEARVPNHIAAVGAWNRGHRIDYDNQPLPPDKEAKSLTCSACGDHGHDCSRCTKRIMSSGNDYYDLAKFPI
jgi:hypothetical protein